MYTMESERLPSVESGAVVHVLKSASIQYRHHSKFKLQLTVKSCKCSNQLKQDIESGKLMVLVEALSWT